MPYLSASPATKSKEIFDALRAIEHETELNSFEVKRLEREAERLIKADAEAGYTVLGAIASLRGDAEAVHAYHKKALKLSGESAESLHNYTASLTKLAEFTTAFEIARKAYDRSPGDASVLECVISAAIFTGHFREASELATKWNASYPHNAYEYDSTIDAVCSATERGIFSEERLQEVLTFAHETLRGAKTRTLRVEIQDDEQEPDSFLYEFFVLASPEEAEDLNEELDARILDRPHLMDDPGLKFMPVMIGANTDGGDAERAS